MADSVPLPFLQVTRIVPFFQDRVCPTLYTILLKILFLCDLLLIVPSQKMYVDLNEQEIKFNSYNRYKTNNTDVIWHMDGDFQFVDSW